MIRVYFNQGNRDKLSAAGRARIAAAQLARWAKFKAKKNVRKALTSRWPVSLAMVQGIFVFSSNSPLIRSPNVWRRGN
jgi:hypothetical protein